MSRNNEIVPIEPKILEWARTRINMSISEVAKKLDKDIDTITNWEKGTELPSLAQLEKLAYTVYKVPLAVFFLPEPPEEPSINRQFRTIPEQEITLLPSALMLKVKEGQYYQEVLKDLFNGKNPVTNPIFKKYSNIQLDSNNVADSIRKDLKINRQIQSSFKDTTEAFKYYREQLENAGIFVFQQTLKKYCRGYSLYDEEFPIIVINSSEISDTGKNFTLFHELSHLLLNMGGLTNEYTYQSNNHEEIFCNKLASSILVDTDELLDDNLIRSNNSIEWSDKILKHLAHDFKVSQEVVLRKLLDLDLTTSRFYSLKREDWLQKLPKKRKGSGGDFYRNKLSKLGNHYATIILSNLYNGRINPYQASEYLGLKINQIPQIERLVFK
jgi:Zn-dependent peptidase ImmA (M78 family)/transcriptional regulator with XRE-family HTH domain